MAYRTVEFFKYIILFYRIISTSSNSNRKLYPLII